MIAGLFASKPAPTFDRLCATDCMHTEDPLWERACSRKRHQDRR